MSNLTEEQVMAQSMERLRIIKDDHTAYFDAHIKQDGFVHFMRVKNHFGMLTFHIPSWFRNTWHIRLSITDCVYNVPVLLTYNRIEYKDGKHISKQYSNFRIETYFVSEFINDKIITTAYGPDHVVFATEITTYDENNEVVSQEDWMHDENGIATLL